MAAVAWSNRLRLGNMGLPREISDLPVPFHKGLGFGDLNVHGALLSWEATMNCSISR